MISLGVFFSFFWNFHFADCCWSKRVKNKPKMKSNNYIRHTPYLRNIIVYDHDFWYTSLKWWYLQKLFSFFWIFRFSGCWGGKMAKNSPKWKVRITSVTHHISYTVKHMMMICVNMCKMMISPGASFIFWYICFLGSYGGKRAKKSPKWKISTSVRRYMLGTV